MRLLLLLLLSLPALGSVVTVSPAQIFVGGAVPANTQIAYSNGTALQGDSGFTRTSLALNLDGGSDGAYSLGQGKFGLATSGSAGQFYLGQAANFTNTTFALSQAPAGYTVLNTRGGQAIYVATGSSPRIVVYDASVQFQSGVITQILDPTEATAVGTASTVLTGGLGVAKRSFLGTIGATFKGNVLAGVQDGTAAVAGQVGEVLSNAQSVYTNFTATATYQQLATIALTAGDWDVHATVTISANSATLTANSNAIAALSTTTASATGATEGQGLVYVSEAALGNSTNKLTAHIDVPITVSAATNYYLNAQATFTAGNPQYVAYLWARRLR